MKFLFGHLFIILSIVTGFSTTTEEELEHIILETQTIITTRHGEARIEMDITSMSTINSCMLTAPNGETFQILPSNLNNVTMDNVHAISIFTCGVRISDMSIQLQGNWTFEADVKPFLSKNYTCEQTFQIVIEEYVEAIPGNHIITYIGEDVYIDLATKPDNIHGCIINANSLEADEMRRTIVVKDNCSFILPDVSKNHNGVWGFGAVGDYTVLSNITFEVKDYPIVAEENINVLHNFPVSLSLGPEDAVFCKTVDPMGTEYIFNGQCAVSIERIHDGHAGVWETYVGLENAVHLLRYNYDVKVLDSTDYPHPTIIKERVILSEDKSLLQMKCSLMTEMKGCRMIRSDGTTFIMSLGIGNGRYSFYGNGVYEDNNGNTISECGIEIQNPDSDDLGSWQCIIVKTDDTEVGKIISGFSGRADENNNNNNDSSNVSQTESNVTTHLDNSFEFTCRHNEKIDYCWIVSPNNTIYSMVEGFSNNEYAYIGQGFDLGECGIRILNAKREQHGLWKCNMGIEDGIDVQQDVRVTIHDSLMVTPVKSHYYSTNITIGCSTYDSSPVEYCRFIRPDGVGINPSKVSSSQYEGSSTDLFNGDCYLTISKPSLQDVGRWTCVAKPYQSSEYVDVIDVYYFWYSRSSPAGLISLLFYIMVTVCLFCVVYFLCARSQKVKIYSSRLRDSFRKNKNPAEIQYSV